MNRSPKKVCICHRYLLLTVQKVGSAVFDRKIMMRKYGLDEGTAYVETQTLLEPNNFIPSWVSTNDMK